MKDVADRAGVSRQLVSLVLRGRPGASAVTRQRVLESVDALGYRRERPVRISRPDRVRRIGVIFSMHQTFQVELVEALLSGVRGSRLSLALCPLTPEYSQNAAVQELVGNEIDAIVLLGADGDAAVADDLSTTVPVITAGGPTSPQARDDVRVDDKASMHKVIEYLSRLGHRCITHVSGGTGPNSEARRKAYLDAMGAFGLAEFHDVVEAEFTEDAGSAAAEILLRRSELPTAIVACNDRAAFGVLETMLRRGVRVPDDVSLVGFDDSSTAKLSFVQLTTMHHDPEQIAAGIIAAVESRLATPEAEPTHRLVRPKLVVRRTTGEPRSS